MAAGYSGVYQLSAGADERKMGNYGFWPYLRATGERDKPIPLLFATLVNDRKQPCAPKVLLRRSKQKERKPM